MVLRQMLSLRELFEEAVELPQMEEPEAREKPQQPSMEKT